MITFWSRLSRLPQWTIKAPCSVTFCPIYSWLWQLKVKALNAVDQKTDSTPNSQCWGARGTHHHKDTHNTDQHTQTSHVHWQRPVGRRQATSEQPWTARWTAANIEMKRWRESKSKGRERERQRERDRDREKEESEPDTFIYSPQIISNSSSSTLLPEASDILATAAAAAPETHKHTETLSVLVVRWLLNIPATC